jgi:hypothetical protein
LIKRLDLEAPDFHPRPTTAAQASQRAERHLTPEAKT